MKRIFSECSLNSTQEDIMYNDQSRFYVIDRDYDVVGVFKGYQSLLTQCYDAITDGRVGDTFKTKFHTYSLSGWTYKTTEIEYIVYDYDDMVVRSYQLRRDITDYSIERVWTPHKRKRNEHVWEYRKDPVPGTGKCRWGCYKFLRHPRFAQDLRESLGHAGHPRTKRMQKLGFVNIWDETNRSDRYDKYSWKKNKKRKQWM